MPQVATVPTKRGGRRPAGILRRSFKFDKEANRSIIYVDFVWVFPEFRGCGLGRQLMGAGLVVGKPKDVRLQVAGSDENRAAVGLYTSLGFAWAKDAPERTEMVCSAELAADAARRIARGPGLPPSPQPCTGYPITITVKQYINSNKIKYITITMAVPVAIGACLLRSID